MKKSITILDVLDKLENFTYYKFISDDILMTIITVKGTFQVVCVVLKFPTGKVVKLIGIPNMPYTLRNGDLFTYFTFSYEGKLMAMSCSSIISGLTNTSFEVFCGFKMIS